MSIPIFVSKLLAVVSSSIQNSNLVQIDENLYRVYFDYYRLKLADPAAAARQFYERNAPIAPEMQLVFNLEDLLDDVYRRAKDAARVEILTELEHKEAIKTNTTVDNDAFLSDQSKLTIDIDDL